jgi:hypothetical protein
MAITNGLIVSLARKKLADSETGGQYGAEDLVNYLNLATALIVSLKPDAYARVSSIKLAAGALHIAPAGTMLVMDITANMGTDGISPGAAIRETTVDLMNRFVASWQGATANASLEHWCRDVDSRTQFWTYPMALGTTYVQAKLSKMPDLIVKDIADAWEDDPFSLGDEYVNAALNGLLFHAYDYDTDVPGNMQRATDYYSRLLTTLGIKEQQTAKREGKQQ